MKKRCTKFAGSWSLKDSVDWTNSKVEPITTNEFIIHESDQLLLVLIGEDDLVYEI